jgi:hypothetical protein
MLPAEPDRRADAGTTELGLQAARLIINACVQDTAVVGRLMSANLLFFKVPQGGSPAFDRTRGTHGMRWQASEVLGS